MEHDKPPALQRAKCMGCEWVVQRIVRTALELVSQPHDLPKQRISGERKVHEKIGMRLNQSNFAPETKN